MLASRVCFRIAKVLAGLGAIVAGIMLAMLGAGWFIHALFPVMSWEFATTVCGLSGIVLVVLIAGWGMFACSYEVQSLSASLASPEEEMSDTDSFAEEIVERLVDRFVIADSEHLSPMPSRQTRRAAARRAKR